jgi:hypothetical protein
MRTFVGIWHKVPLTPHSTPVGRLSQTLVTAVLATAALIPAAARQSASVPDLAGTLARVGQRVEQWYSRAQNIVSTETVWIQPLRYDMSPIDFPRRLAYELRVAWDPEQAKPGSLPEASVLRQVLAVNGRAPKPGDEPGCMDPKPVSPEPLAMLLASRRDDFRFTLAGETRVDGRAAVMIDYRGVAAGPPEVTWRENCVSISLPGRSRGRVWIDAATYDVLRLDEQLVGPYEFPVPREHQRRGAAASMSIDRADSSIQFKRVDFRDPDEVLLLPATIDTFQIVRGGGIQRTRITQRFSDYRRFITGGRIVQ